MQKRIRVTLAVLFIILLTTNLSFAQSDKAGSKDHPLFSRMPGFYIAVYEASDFDSHTFWDEKRNQVKVDGRYYQIQYEPKEGTTPPSPLQIHRNYENAIRQVGGTVLYSDDEYSFMKLVKGDKEIWVELTAYGPKPNLVIIEKQTMKQDVLANADAFAKDIHSTGHAAVYGIYFDTGKSVIKPESETALKEIAKLLQGDPGLKVHVVGHTDNVGGLEANMKLSLDRANAVVQSLTGKHGIAATRLKAGGVGPLAPVAANDSDAGKAKNRRVELVKQ
jgi:outer membrane protein OmpA-like peptidoglycan-associated protein